MKILASISCLVVLASSSYAKIWALRVGRQWEGKGGTPCETATAKAERKETAAEDADKTGLSMIPELSPGTAFVVAHCGVHPFALGKFKAGTA